jgi:hypothetical protein
VRRLTSRSTSAFSCGRSGTDRRALRWVRTRPLSYAEVVSGSPTCLPPTVDVQYSVRARHSI